MSVLNGTAIKEAIKQNDYRKKLLITPLLDENQIGPASVDIRLGSSIIVPKRTFVGSHDITDPSIIEQVEERLYDRIRLRYQTAFILHPNQLILAVTLEYIVLPTIIFAQVVSRSSWGRLGLVVATASLVHPGFKGCLTLELANLSDSPITLYPGLLIGQLIFYEVKTLGEPPAYTGRYDCPTDAGLPQFFSGVLDDEMSFWGKGANASGP